MIFFSEDMSKQCDLIAFGDWSHGASMGETTAFITFLIILKCLRHGLSARKLRQNVRGKAIN